MFLCLINFKLDLLDDHIFQTTTFYKFPLQLIGTAATLKNIFLQVVKNSDVNCAMFLQRNEQSDPSGAIEMTWDHAQSLIITGLTMGILHVLAGPDHLSALAVLSVGNSWRAMTLGFRWGMGHSTGLIFVAIIFIALKGDLDLRTLGRYCDLLVGAFMIVLGGYGVIGALKMFREKNKKRDIDLEVDINAIQPQRSPSNETVKLVTQDADCFVEKSDWKDSEDSMFHHHDDGIDSDCESCPFLDMRDPFTQRMVSFSIGILHGVAGPGGILGVLPAVEMQNWMSSAIYLGTFVCASTLSMGGFAALYGEITKRIGATQQSLDFALRVFSSSMSIIVGTIWFVLSILGKLEDFFH